MNNQIEQKIKSIISKLEGNLNKPSNSQNQERFYRIYKKLMSISIHCDTNVSAFELENETSPDSSKENLETKITLNKTDENNSLNSSSFSSKKEIENNEINIFNNKIDLDEFLNILDKDLNDINENNNENNENKINDENLKSPQNLNNNNNNINENCESYFFNENLKKKFLKIEEILKNYLENKQNKKKKIFISADFDIL